MPRCIYCQIEKGDEEFNREHVLPESFGRFNNNLTLINIVCTECNQYFGDNLDIHLARDSFEGRSRFIYGISRPEDFRSPRRSRIHIKITEGPLKGMYAYPEYSPVVDDVIIMPCAQVGFLIDGSYEYFLLEELPDAQYLEDNGFDSSLPNCISALGASVEDFRRKLEERQIDIPNLRLQRDGNSRSGSDTVLCEVTGIVDEIIYRAVAKIVFNYLAYFHEQEFLHHEAFDPIRKFVRYGECTEYRLVEARQEAILEDEPIEGQRVLAHLITTNVSGDGNSIVGQVALFNHMTYRVILSTNYIGQDLDIRRGHVYDCGAREISELGVR